MQFTTTALITALALTTSAFPNLLGERYVPGNCGVHLTQYQIGEGPGSDTSHYRFTIILKDAIGEEVGGVSLAEMPDGSSVSVDSQLPLVFVATVRFTDDDEITFGYGGQHWGSSQGQCSVGGYDSGSRQMDCGFTC